MAETSVLGKDSRQNCSSRQLETSIKRIVPARWVYLLIIMVGVIVTCLIGYGYLTGLRMNSVFVQMIDSTKGLMLEATSAHLWLEEILSGDSHEPMEAVQGHLDRAERFVEAMRKTGKDARGVFRPLVDDEMQQAIEEIKADLAEFRAITQARWLERETSGVGTDIDQRYDTLFYLFINKARTLESRLRELMAQQLRDFKSTQWGLVIFCVLLFIAVGISFNRFERRRTRDYMLLHEAKGNLEEQVNERRHTEEMLQSERDKLQGILNAIGEGMYITNRRHTIEFHNEKFEQIFGNRIGRRCCDVVARSADPCGMCQAEKTRRSGQINQADILLPNGNSYDMIFSPYRDADGEVKTIVLLRDVTEKKRLQADAMRVSHLASLGELAAGVAHEINNPISGIINFAEILKDEFDAKGESAEIPERIIKEGDRIARIVSNLLSFARDRQETFGALHIQDIVTDTLGLVEQQLLKDGIALHLHIPPDIPPVRARSQEIQQVFLNILSNGRYALNRKFPEAHADKLLEIGAEAVILNGDRFIRTTFYDQGTGIPADLLDKIINPFFSTKPQGEGTGLGLSISHGIIQRHGGRLELESRKGVFTRVIVDLPVANSEVIRNHDWESINASQNTDRR